MISAAELLALTQIILIDVSLAGDNAIAVGTAASGLHPKQRKQAVLAGIGTATVLRILFALFAVQIMRVTGLLAAGGLILLWVAWKMYRDIRAAKQRTHSEKPAKKLSDAILQIAIADVSMSLDNVLAVAGVARDHMGILAIGLLLSVVLMGAAAALIAKWTERYPWIAYLGLAIVLFTALHMMWDGAHQLLGS
ncbi:MAG TPA: YjbE family putative metal transport protein [Alphaproteobacteria bacterium]|nr:YjbE family putative metal transport protein [Alphaproteobacteria bacterium]